MIEERLITVAKERYDLEFTRRGYLIASTGIYFTALNLLLFIIMNLYLRTPLTMEQINNSTSLLILNWFSLTFTYLSTIHLIFYASTISFVIFTGLTVITLVKLLWGQEYTYLPLPSEIREYVEELQNYYDQNYDNFFKEAGSKDHLINHDLHQNLLEKYIECAENNESTNSLRSNKITKIGRYLLIAVVILAINFISFFLLK